MKILHVTPILGPKNGGSATIPLELAMEQALMGNKVTIITSDLQLDNKLLDRSDKVRIESFECRQPLNMLFFAPKMKGWLEQNIMEYDIVHLHNFRSYQSIIVRKCAVDHNIPYILQAHGAAQIIEGKKLQKKLFDLVWGHKIVGEASACVAVSRHEIDHYLDLGATRSSAVVIPNAVSPAARSANFETDVFRKLYHTPAGTRMILYLGRLNRRKGIDVLIRSFSKIKRVRNDVMLIIVGLDDGFETTLRAMVKDGGLEESVRFHGFIDDPITAYRGADVLVYPSRQEIFGLVPFESILCGTPVIVCDDSGCGEIVTQARCGLTVPPDDPEALSNAIRYMLDNPSEAQSMIKNGRDYIEENLIWPLVAREFEHLYQRCIAENAKASSAKEGPPSHSRSSK